MSDTILEMNHITKTFGAFKANDDISFQLRKSEVLTFLGENGAGKSTLMNVLCGLYHPTEGSIIVNGEECKFNSPADAVIKGIGMVHQHFMLIDNMTVFQNIIMGLSQDKSQVINIRKLKKNIQELADRYSLEIEFDKYIYEISVGAQQRVEILKALWRGAEVLILDEPTAVLTDEETDGLFKIIGRLKEENKSVIFISHKLKEVMEISDRILVLRQGQLVDEVKVEEANEQILADKMIGKQLIIPKYEKKETFGDVVFSAKNINYRAEWKHGGLHNINLDIHAGEIFCVAGVDGNGQSELAQLFTGLIKPDSGEVIFKNKKLERYTPLEFINSGESHVPEDRNRMGLIGEMTVAENLIVKVNRHNFYSWKGWKSEPKEINEFSEELIEKYDIRCRSTHQKVEQLSGGNQQKVILARELEQQPSLLVAVHPTRGLDIGATTMVHDCIAKARDTGCAVLMISTDISEVLMMADRLCVMYEGGIMGIYNGKNPPIEKISLAMMGKA